MGSKQQTVTQSADPWKPAQSYLTQAMSAGGDLFDQGGFAQPVYGGDRVAGFGDVSQQGQQMMLDQAQQPGMTGTAQGTIGRMMDPSYTSEQLNAVKQNALSSAIPAATSAFSGSGMLNSTMAMDTVGRAATDAIAPYEYGAYENAQGRALSAAGMAPELDRASYIPGQMTASIGGAQDAMSQAMIDADMQRFYESANPELRNLQGFSQFMLPISGQGGTSTQSQPGASGIERLASGGLMGVGTYGALAAAGVANPYLLPLALGAGVMGMI